ncbi:hypothetical protein QTP88_028942, partial [Uroleucon formosanum]
IFSRNFEYVCSFLYHLPEHDGNNDKPLLERIIQNIARWYLETTTSDSKFIRNFEYVCSFLCHLPEHGVFYIHTLYVSHFIDIVLYLSKQGIAFRGHEETSKSINKGNFKEMCELFAKHVPSFNKIHERKINLTIWQIQEDIIEICAILVKKEIFKQIVETGFFAMFDEARYTVKFQVFERFLGFVNVSTGQDANHIQKVYMNAIKIIAHSYDGASVMSGHFNGVQSKIKDFYPCAIYTHCMAHRLNLVVGARAIFNVLEAVNVHFSRLLKNSKLCDVQSKLIFKKRNMYKNCESMLNNFNAIVEYLKNEINEQLDKDIAQAIDVLSIMNILSNSLQSKTATLGKFKNIIESVIKTFETSRTDEEFHNVWKKIVKFADENNTNLQIPTMGSKRQRRETQHFHDYMMLTTTANEVVNSNTTMEIYWRRVAYMPVIDSRVLLMASSVDCFIKMDFVGSSYFINHYKSVLIIDIHALKSEMTVASNCMKTIKSDFDINDVSKVIENHVYPNLYKLLQVAISIPISSATCERSFSSMKRIKNCLRTSVTRPFYKFGYSEHRERCC